MNEGVRSPLMNNRVGRPVYREIDGKHETCTKLNSECFLGRWHEKRFTITYQLLLILGEIEKLNK